MVIKRRTKDSCCLITQSCLALATSWTVACQAPLSMEFSRQEHWSGLPFPSPKDFPDPGVESTSPAWQVDSLSHLKPQRTAIPMLPDMQTNNCFIPCFQVIALSLKPNHNVFINRDFSFCFHFKMIFNEEAKVNAV